MVSVASQSDQKRDYVLVAADGPSIMEAANRVRTKPVQIASKPLRHARTVVSIPLLRGPENTPLNACPRHGRLPRRLRSDG